MSANRAAVGHHTQGDRLHVAVGTRRAASQSQQRGVSAAHATKSQAFACPTELRERQWQEALWKVSQDLLLPSKYLYIFTTLMSKTTSYLKKKKNPISYATRNVAVNVGVKKKHLF